MDLTNFLTSDIITKLVRKSSNISGNIHKAMLYEFPTYASVAQWNRATAF